MAPAGYRDPVGDWVVRNMMRTPDRWGGATLASEVNDRTLEHLRRKVQYNVDRFDAIRSVPFLTIEAAFIGRLICKLQRSIDTYDINQSARALVPREVV